MKDKNLFVVFGSLFSNCIPPPAEENGDDDGSSDESRNAVDWQGTLETRHASDEVAQQGKSCSAEGRGWHEDAVVATAEKRTSEMGDS